MIGNDSPTKEIKRINSELYSSIAITFILGILAYGYTLIIDAPAHDGIMQITTDQKWMIQIGRWLIKYYVMIRGTMNAPWFIGALAFLYIGLAVFFTFLILDIPFMTQYQILIAGLYVCSVAIMSAATLYTYIMDVNSLALLMAVLAVFFIAKYEQSVFVKYGLGLVCMALSMGLYQSYIAVTVSLFMLVAIKKLLDNKIDCLTVIVQGLKYIVALIGGGVLYWALLRVVVALNKMELWTGSYNSVTNVFSNSKIIMLKQVPYAYMHLFRYLFTMNNPFYSRLFIAVNVIVLLVGIIIWAKVINGFKDSYKKILLMILLVLLPLGMNCVYVLANAVMLPLMTFSFLYYYVAAVLPAFYLTDNEEKQWNILNGVYINAWHIIVALLGTVIIISIQFSNGMAHYQRLVSIGTQARVNNLIHDIEAEPGFDGDILIIGQVSDHLGGEYRLSEKYASLSGVNDKGTTITYNPYLETYLHCYYGKKYHIIENADLVQKYQCRDEVKEMPVYPTRGYCKMVGDYLVVKFE